MISGPAPFTGESPSITTQPANVSVPLGEATTFTVVAGGTDPLQYQWNNADGPIAGATSASYTTPQVVQSDNGSVFKVTVSNAGGAVTSAAATLTVGPRSPKPGDWRFKGVDFAPTLPEAIATNIFGFDGTATLFYGNTIGSPLEIGPGMCVSGVPFDCGWLDLIFDLPQGTSGPTSIYQAGLISNLTSDLNSLSTPDTVITSLDVEESNQIYGVSAIRTPHSNQFLAALHSLPLNGLQAAATQEGAASRVITAISFNANMVEYMSYGWRQDTTTKYETSVVSTTVDNAVQDAASLAAAGYIITAFGGNNTDGFILIGTRVQGDTLPRPFSRSNDFFNGYAIVAYLSNANNGNTTAMMGEK